MIHINCNKREHSHTYKITLRTNDIVMCSRRLAGSVPSQDGEYLDDHHRRHGKGSRNGNGNSNDPEYDDDDDTANTTDAFNSTTFASFENEWFHEHEHEQADNINNSNNNGNNNAPKGKFGRGGPARTGVPRSRCVCAMRE